MKLYVCSDLHLEFGDLTIHNRDDVDLLILSGDICVAKELLDARRGPVIADFFRHVSSQFPHVIYIMGNHEHYGGDFGRSGELIREMISAKDLDNVRFLDKETTVIDDYLFIGGTLWTDFNEEDPLTMVHSQWSMNDYRGVKNRDKGAGGGWKFLPQDALDDHKAMLKLIDDTITQRRAGGDHSDRVVVVGHHSPSRLSTHPRYQHDHIVNGAYSSNLDRFISERPEICLWTHGHTHEDFDYNIGTTRIVCNPRGYIGYEPRAESWQPKLIELP